MHELVKRMCAGSARTCVAGVTTTVVQPYTNNQQLCTRSSTGYTCATAVCILQT